MKIKKQHISLSKLLLPVVFFAMQWQANGQDKVADNMLIYQRSYGGWPKHINDVKIDYNKTMNDELKHDILSDSLRKDGTIDNHATTKEIRYLLNAYKKHNNPLYLQAAQKGVTYLLKAQNASGGWPQFYPDSSLYRGQITFNDNAMINVLNLLMDVAEGKNDTEVLDPVFAKMAKQAVDKGVRCILNLQVVQNGKLSGWCAQYDQKTLKPATARKYEHPSLSGMESVGIVSFLMRIPNPYPEMITAVDAAIDWFKRSDIEGYTYKNIDEPSSPKGFDRVLVAAPGKRVWARFYDLETNKPFFSGRDGVKRSDLMEVEMERRIGYAWYGEWPEELLSEDYPKWKEKIAQSSSETKASKKRAVAKQKKK